jgi:competence protein ComEA
MGSLFYPGNPYSILWELCPVLKKHHVIILNFFLITASNRQRVTSIDFMRLPPDYSTGGLIVTIMTEKNPEFPDFNRLRQKGLFLFSLLILGFLGFRTGEMASRRTLPDKAMASPKIFIEVEGAFGQPALLGYSQTTTVQQVIRDGGGVLDVQTLSASAGKEVLIRDSSLKIEGGKNGTMFIQQKPLSLKALWIIGRPLPLNRATAEDLDRIPGIGPGLARRIVEYRQGIGFFSSLVQLMEVNGIKEKTFEKIKRYLTL